MLRSIFFTFIAAFFSFGSISAVGPYVYVSNFGTGNVSVIDASTNTVVKIIPTSLVGTRNVGATPDGHYIYVGNELSPNVVVIDTQTLEIVDTITFSGDSVFAVVFSPDSKTGYAGISSLQSIGVFDVETNTIQQNIFVGDGALYGLAITPDGQYIYTRSSSNVVNVVSTATNSVVAEISLGATYGRPFDMTISNDGTRLYISEFNLGTYAVINTTTNALIGHYPAGFHPAGLDITPDGRYLYIVNSDSASVNIVDLQTNTIVQSIPLGANGVSPQFIAITPDGTQAYISAYSSDSVVVLDLATNTVAQYITGMVTPIGVNIAYVAPPPASCIKGKRTKNDFAIASEYFNILRWDPPAISDLQGYLLYRNGNLIKSLKPKVTYYEDHNRNRHKADIYALFTLDSNGLTSNPATVTIKGK